MVLIAEAGRAAIVPVEASGIPEELKQRPRWCVWKAVPTKDGTKLTKKPMQASRPTRGLSKTTPSEWRDYPTALKAYEQNRGTRVDGLGFMTGGGVVALDFDECVDELTREIRPDVASMVARLNTYAEFSPSGKGVRVFVLGELPGENVTSKATGCEMYAEGAYVTVTGVRVPGTPAGIAPAGEAVEELWQRAVAHRESKKAPKKASVASAGDNGHVEQKAGSEARKAPSGEDILSLVRRSSNASAVEALLDGQWEGTYPTQSEAELALANHLAFYAGPGGEAVVERLMRESKLNRDKFSERRGEGATYLSLTVGTAYAGRTDFYSGKAATGKAVEVALPNGMASTGPAALDDSSTLTDIGLARRLTLEANGTLRYVREWKSWLAWDGRRWVQDDGLAAQHIAKQVSDELWRELAELSSERRSAVVSFVKGAASSRSIDAAVKLARSEPGVILGSSELNTHDYLLNVKNGTLDLANASLLPHCPSRLITHLAEVEFDPQAGCPTWRKFVDDVTNGDKELKAFLQRSCGLALSGDVTEQSLWLHYGEGRNGKSTMLNVMSEILGTYAGPAPLEMLLVKNRGKEVEVQFAALAGLRFVTAVEADCGVRFSEATVKLLTGGDTVLARRLYENPWPLKPTWKLHIAANHKPTVRGTDTGIWRRLTLVPWLRRFEGEADDKGLKAKLLAERSGILNWCLAGFVQWREQGGLQPPKCVLAATEEYRGENDVLGTWMEECCVRKADAMVEAGSLYRNYKNWCEDRGEHVMTGTKFGLEMERLGFASSRPSAGHFRNRTIRRGIGILSSHDDE